MQFAYPYLILFAFYLYWYYKHRSVVYKNALAGRKGLCAVDFFPIAVYLLFYGLRGFIFTDCFQYYDYFVHDAGGDFSWDFVDFRFEPGYMLCNKIIHMFTNNFFVFQFIWTAIDVLLLISILKREVPRHYLLAFALLIPFFDGIQMNLFRNVKGILICFYALKYVRKRNLVKYSALVILASTIHMSSLFFLPLYFIVNRNLHIIQSILVAVSVIMYFMDLSFLNDLLFYIGLVTGGGKIDAVFQSYAYSTKSAGFTLGLVYRTTLAVTMLVMYKKLSAKNLVFLNVAIFYIVCCTAFNSILAMRDRLGQLFALGIICVLPFLLNDLKELKYSRLFVCFNLLCLFGQVYIQHNNMAAKYENVITGVSNRSEAEIRIFNAAEKYGEN